MVRRFTLRQVSTLMGALGMACILLAASYIAASQRRVLFAEGQDHAEQTAAFLADHARRLFEVSDLVLHAVDASVAGLGWARVEGNPDVEAGLRRMDDMLPYVDAVFAVDPTGTIRITTLPNPPHPYMLSDRRVLAEAAADTSGAMLIGDPIVGRVSHRETFVVGRRLSTPDGRFTGMAGAAMTLSYFTDYWRTVDKRNDEQIALVRADTGGVLARYPGIPWPATSTAALKAATAGGAARGTFVPGPHMFGTFERVGDLPVVMAVVFHDAVITHAWHETLWHLVPLTLATVLALLGITLLARRLARREEVARRQIETARAVLSAANTRLERRVAERTADLVESNREIQRFAYIVSHDLRAPLVNIMGFTSELRGLRDEVLATPAAPAAAQRERWRAEFDEAFGFIGTSIDKMDRLIKAILALSRQGQRSFKAEPLDMNALVRGAADAVAHQLQARGATLTIGQLPPLTADRMAVEQVFANLIDNAVKYLREDIAGTVAIEGVAGAATVAYTVTDNGRGIAPADRERVFELFRRAGKQDRPGEGIGLANVRSLIRRLEGTITLDSTVGQGCIFTVTLPRTMTPTEDDGAR